MKKNIIFFISWKKIDKTIQKNFFWTSKKIWFFKVCWKNNKNPWKTRFL